MTDKPTLGGRKLLSICLTGKDDNYMLDFRYRITTTINYIARNLKQIRRLDDVEILVTDWGSEVPLAQTLPLSPEASQICRFIYVPPTVVCAVQNGSNGFNISCATNIALRRARGNFLMIFGADTLVPQRSLETILTLLDRKLHIPVAVDRTYFMCSRYHVPMQFVQRQPNPEEWDRYLLLNASNLKPEESAVFSISSGAGALMMHSSLWHELRGLGETLGGWGFNDNELGLRVTQCYPWVELSSVGVSLFHMEHTPFGRRPSSIKQNASPHVYNSRFQMNDENWGLGDYELQTQKPQSICASEHPSGSLALPLKSQPQNVKSWDCSRQEVLAEFTGKTVRDHVRRIIKLFLTGQVGWNIDDGDIDSLFFLAWYSRYHCPRRYLEFGIKRGYAAAVVAAASPSVEIYGVDSWEGALYRHTPLNVAAILRWAVAHQGYLRFINGDINTAVQRLRDSFIGSFFFDLVLVRGDMLGADALDKVRDVLRHLAAGGALVFTCASAERFAFIWSEIQRQVPQFTYLKCKGGSTGLILAASLQGDGCKGTVNENYHFKKKLIRLHIQLKRWEFRRLYYALKKPRRYPEYAGRVWRWVKQKSQS